MVDVSNYPTHRQTYEPIYTLILPSDSAEVSINSIPSNFTDIICTISGRYNGISNMRFRINGDSGQNYSYTILSGSGSTAESIRGSNVNFTQADYYAALGSTNPGTAIINFMSYSNTNVFKTILMSSGSADTAVHRVVGLWRSTSAINSINFINGGNTYRSGTVFSVYGIKAAV